MSLQPNLLRDLLDAQKVRSTITKKDKQIKRVERSIKWQDRIRRYESDPVKAKKLYDLWFENELNIGQLIRIRKEYKKLICKRIITKINLELLKHNYEFGDISKHTYEVETKKLTKPEDDYEFDLITQPTQKN
jgi:polynucleotide 5'-kinase involved in rRNA processing